MRFTDLFIRRPVLAIVVNLLIVIAGLHAWHSLNIRQYPRSENSTVSISTVYVGASAELVRGFITTPLERAIAAADALAGLAVAVAVNVGTDPPFRRRSTISAPRAGDPAAAAAESRPASPRTAGST